MIVVQVQEGVRSLLTLSGSGVRLHGPVWTVDIVATERCASSSSSSMSYRDECLKDRVGYSDTIALHIHSVLNLLRRSDGSSRSSLFPFYELSEDIFFVFCTRRRTADRQHTYRRIKGKREAVCCTYTNEGEWTLLVLVCYS